VEDLKKQMAIDEAKKKKEYSWLHEPTKTTLIEKDPAPERNCDSCEKRYP
jgi:Glu-tRNA(Gln) amidotransferase subunit E-like FAD-binding protein